MFNPEDYFCITGGLDAVKFEVKVTDSQNREIWGEVPDSFTPDDLDSIANMFANYARTLRDLNSNR